MSRDKIVVVVEMGSGFISCAGKVLNLGFGSR